jgi:hypothetical protein
MKTERILLWLAATFFLCGPLGALAGEKTENLAQPTEIQGLPCQGRVNYFENGQIQDCTLARAHTLMGQLLPAGTEILFTPSGGIWNYLLGRDATISGQPLPAGSRVFGADMLGRVRFWPSRDILIQGHLCKAVDDGIGHYMYPDGKLCAIWLKQDEVIDGVYCTSSANMLTMPLHVLFLGTERMAWFYEDGRLRQAMLSRDCTVQGHAFKKGDVISMDPEGKLDLSPWKLGAETRGPVKPPWWPK